MGEEREGEGGEGRGTAWRGGALRYFVSLLCFFRRNKYCFPFTLHPSPPPPPNTTSCCAFVNPPFSSSPSPSLPLLLLLLLLLHSFFQIPPIAKLDNSLNSLKNCEQLSLSTNSIDRLSIGLGGMTKLRILSVGRNVIKRIEKLEEVAETLEELWISYNQITTLDGLDQLKNLQCLYMGNNNIKAWAELDKLKDLPALRDILLVGNPIYAEFPTREEARVEVLRHLPGIQKIDGQMVKPSERDAAAEPRAE